MKTRLVRYLGADTQFADGPEQLSRAIGCPVVAAWLEPTTHCLRPPKPGRPSFQLKLCLIETGPEEGRLTQAIADILSQPARSSPAHCPWMGMNFQVFSGISGRTLTRLSG